MYRSTSARDLARHAQAGGGGRFLAGESLQIGSLEVTAARVEHDAYEPLQYVISDGQRRFGMLPTLACTTRCCWSVTRPDALLIEANHCRDLLATRSLPASSRGGQQGHLNNHQAARLVAELGWRTCNTWCWPTSAARTTATLGPPVLRRYLGCDPDWLQVANQDHGLDWRLIA
jgi:hypothetical protein